MVVAADKYATLICSLPGFESMESVERTPISRIQLRQRLKLLDSDDCRDIQILGETLDWFRQPAERSDAEFIRRLKSNLAQLHSEFVKDCIIWRLELRTIIAALRHKKLDLPAPNDEWGFGRWLPIMQRHWQEPLLGLEELHPWVSEVKRLLDEEQGFELERFILLHVWHWLKRLETHHEFDFPAVAIYRMKWDLVARWISYDSAVAEQRFEKLLDDALNQNTATTTD